MRSINQRGSVLIMIIIAIVMMAVLGLGIYTLTSSSSLSELLAGNDYEAYQLAKAGMRFAINQLNINPNYAGGTYLVPNANNTFTVAVANNVITVTGTTKQGLINFLTANRTLAYNYSWAANAGTISFANNMSGFGANTGSSTGSTTNAAAAIVVNTVTNTVGLGGNVYDSYGTLLFKGNSNVGNCVNGVCNFSNGIRAFFNFTFTNQDSSSTSTSSADGFTFAVISALTNTSDRTGGAPAGYSMGELMGYAGPGNTSDGLGLRPPKMALTFDTYPNGTYGICSSDSRKDPTPFYNNATFMFWGSETPSPTTCTYGTSYPSASFDDNVHGAGGSSGDPQNPTSWDYTGPSMPCRSNPSSTCNFMEDGYGYSARVEIMPTTTPYTYSLKAWIVRQDNSAFTTANWNNFKNVIVPYTDTTTQISKTVTLSAADYNNFQKVYFGFTEATGGATQIVTLDSLNVFFPTSSTGHGSQTIGTITFNPATLSVGGTATASATATSGLAVTFSSLTTGICYVGGTNGSTVTAIGAGTCTIAANQAGDTYYYPAPQVTGNITVGKANQATLTVNATTPLAYNTSETLSSAGGSGTGAVTYAATGGGGGSCTVSGTTLTANSGTGYCDVTATKAADANYNATTSAAVRVYLGLANQATLTVNATTPLAYNTSETLSSAGGSGTGAVTYAATGGGGGSCTVSGTTLTATSGTGTCSVTATKAADTNYNATTSAAVVVTLSKVNQATLTVNATTPLAYLASETLSTSGGSGTGAVTYSATGSCTVSGTTLTANSGTGTCSVTATKAADANYNATTSAAAVVTLSKANQATLTVNATTPLAYLASETLSSTGGSGTGAVTYSATGSCTVSGTTLTANSGTGTCSVTATKAADTNYNATTSAAVVVTLSKVNQATLTVNATTPLTYNTSETLSSTGGSGTGAVTYAATGGGGGSCTVSGTTLTATSGTGYCDVTATKAADTNYNATTSAAVRVTLNCPGYRVWNNTGARYDFQVTGQACQINLSSGNEITTSTVSTQLGSGETVSRYTRNSNCGTYQGQIPYTNAVTADTNGNCQVNYNSGDTAGDR